MQRFEDVSEKVSPLLVELEEAVSTPCVPGEMESWLGRIREIVESIDRLRPALAERSKQISAEIAEADFEMEKQADELTKGEEEVLNSLESYGKWISSLSEKDDLEAKGNEYSQIIPQVVTRGRDIAFALRKQENAARTYLLEALERDRGDVD